MFGQPPDLRLAWHQRPLCETKLPFAAGARYALRSRRVRKGGRKRTCGGGALRRSIDTERTLIVAFSGTHTPGKLPPIRYLSGGLESAEMRKHVCDILEGGDRAFKERARRLRVRLDR